MKLLVTLLILLGTTFPVSAFEGSFSTSGTRLLDANGKEFVMRGANYSWCWQRGKERSVIPAAKRIGCNTIRIQLGTGKRFYRPSAQQLEELITLCEQNKLVAVFNTHDATGSDNYADLDDAARFWVEMKDVLNRHCATTLVNITNEWFGSMNNSAAWADGYCKAIKIIRDAGIKNTLIVDAAGWGQWPKSIFEKADVVAGADRENNLVFSIHMYDVAGKSYSTVKKNIDNALGTGYPVIIGEFAYQHGGKPVAWQAVLDYTAEKNVGYLVWSWTGNSGGVEDCDMFAGYDESEYLPNGTNTVLGKNGIKETSKECSIYSELSSVGDIVTADANAAFDYSRPYEIYNILGCRVSEMTRGNIYILRQENIAVKILY